MALKQLYELRDLFDFLTIISFMQFNEFRNYHFEIYIKSVQFFSYSSGNWSLFKVEKSLIDRPRKKNITIHRSTRSFT